jgi:phospholipid N-methyltransferase
MKVEGRKEPFKVRGPLRSPASAVYPRPGRVLRQHTISDAGAPGLHLYWRFLVASIVHHTQTGGILPSQRFLIDRMISAVPADYRGRIVELGPGTGVLTLRLAARCQAADILACEINPDLAEVVQNRVRIEGLERRVKVLSEPAEQLLSTLAQDHARSGPEFIISGIPLGNLARDSAIALVELIRNALVPGGQYIQFQYSLLDRKKIKVRFSRMRTVPVLLNFPPAFVYYAWK